MRPLSPSFLEMHWDKALLGATAGLALYLAAVYLFESPNTLRYDGRELTPGELNAAILHEAQALEQMMRTTDAPLPEVPRYHRQLRALQAAGIYGLHSQPSEVTPSRELRLATTFGTAFDLPLARHAPVRVVTPLPPTRPTLLTGRCLLALEPDETRQLQHEEGAAGDREVGWVRVTARIARQQQRQALLAAGYPSYASRVYPAGVDAQRQEFLAEGGFSEWKNVKPSAAPLLPQIPTPLFDDRNRRLLNREALDAAFHELKTSQELLARPPFGPVVAGDRPPAAAEEPDDNRSGPPEDAIVIWVHDEEAEPGKTYRYRVRVRLWNRFVGRANAVQDPNDARRAAIEGSWSAPSEPVTAAPRRHFFVLGPSVIGSAANLEVWKWHRGRWRRKSFAAGVGDVIGEVRTIKTDEKDESGRPVRERVDFNTGVVVLDIRTETRALRLVDHKTGQFEWSRRPTLVMVCLDPADGRVKEKVQATDRADPLRKRLRGLVAKRATADLPPDTGRGVRPMPPRPTGP